MTAYVLGAGASANAGYPLASKLLQGLSDWLDRYEDPEDWVNWCRNRIVQVRETFGSLDDFEGILGTLEEYGHERVKPTGATTYRQDYKDLFHDCTKKMQREDCGNPDVPAEGFYPQYLRSDLIMGFRELFYQTEQKRSGPTAYDSFAEKRIGSDSTVITLNYDLALERALIKAGRWDIGTGYGYTAFADRAASPTTIYKLHGSVNWFQTPMQEIPPPLIFSRDLTILGYDGLVDPRIGPNGVAVNNSGTFIMPEPKKKFYWEQFWLPLWTVAADRLRDANEVFIHGYSMPTADSHARQLLFDNINKRAAINVHCRSSSDLIAEDFRSRGFKNVSSFPVIDFETWATSV
jgi:hypothetical protein